MDFGIRSGSLQLNAWLAPSLPQACCPTLEGLWMPTAQLRCQCLHHPASTGNFWPKHRGTIIPCETLFGGCAHGSHMLTGLDLAFNTMTGIFFFLSLFIFQSLPQEGAIFLLKSQLARCLAQNQVTGSNPSWDPSCRWRAGDDGCVPTWGNALVLPTKVKPGP